MRTFTDSLILVYLLVTFGGLYTTFTHQPFFILPEMTHFSYGMLAPYQGDDDQNVEWAVVGTDSAGRTTLVPIDQYFPGLHGERNARQNFNMLFFAHPQQSVNFAIAFLTQILDHERAKGHAYVRLDLLSEQWTRSSDGYDALHPKAVRTFLAQVQ